MLRRLQQQKASETQVVYDKHEGGRDTVGRQRGTLQRVAELAVSISRTLHLPATMVLPIAACQDTSEENMRQT